MVGTIAREGCFFFFWKRDGIFAEGELEEVHCTLVGFCDYIILARDTVVVESDFSNFGPRYLQRVNNVRVSSAIYQSEYMLWRGTHLGFPSLFEGITSGRQ